MCGLFGWFTSLLQKLFKMAMSMGSFATRTVATVVVALDGTGDFTDIQEGIDSLPATGGGVYIKEGNYVLTATINLAVDNVSLIGCGRSTQLYNATASPIINITADNIHIEKIYFYSDDIIFMDCLYFNGSDNCTVYSCWFEDWIGNAIYFTNCTNMIIYDNHFLASSSGNSTIYGTFLDDSLIFGNIFDGVKPDGISLSECLRDVISNNIFLSVTAGRALFMSEVDDSIIEGNFIRNTSVDGAYFGSCDNCVISGNVITDCNTTSNANSGGLRLPTLDKGVISNNLIFDNNIFDVKILAGSDRNVFIGNNLRGAGVGIFIDLGTNTQIAHNII